MRFFKNNLSLATTWIASFLSSPELTKFINCCSTDIPLSSCSFSALISLSVFPDITKTNSPLGLFSKNQLYASSIVPLYISSWSFVNSLHTAIFLFHNDFFK